MRLTKDFHPKDFMVSNKADIAKCQPKIRGMKYSALTLKPTHRQLVMQNSTWWQRAKSKEVAGVGRFCDQ